MNRRFVLPALAMGVVLATGANGFAFCGLFGGHGGGGCCEPSCGYEADCGCEPSCGCAHHGGRRGCCILGGLKGLFNRHRHHDCCCEVSCAAEPSCGYVEPSCGYVEPDCGYVEPGCGCEADCCCEPACGRRGCGLFGCLRGLFNRNRGCCGYEASCGCDSGYGYDAGCGCGG